MKTNTTQGHLVGWSVRFGMAALAVAFATTGFAQPTQNGSSNNKNRKMTATVPLKSCYVYLSTASPFPQPIERFSSIPSTASPMNVIGEAPVLHCRR